MSGERGKRLIYNTSVPFLYEIVGLICSFILPRLIISAFGSEVNGLVSSIAQFLAIISFLDFGVGRVIQSTLYKPLAERNEDEVSRIYVSGQRFYRVIATILVVYIALLMIFYPLLTKRDFSWIFTATLILCMGISSFAQYYFGIVNQLLLNADQRGYVQYSVQIVTLILNTALCCLMIWLGFGIHIVRLTTAIVFLLRPILFRIYVDRHYNINRKITYDEEPIKQKRHGVAQHVSAVVLDSTDSIVLTIFSTLANVSIYSIYQMIVYGVKKFFNSMTVGIVALLGELWAKGEREELSKTFFWYEWSLHTVVVLLFGCTGVLILPFVKIYTLGITDAEYIQPLFAALITIANGCHCLRMPYHSMILATGDYKRTQRCYIIAVVMNIVISIAAVIKFGLIGVAVGTLVAMVYQTIWMAINNSKNYIPGAMRSFIKQVAVDLLTVVVALIATLHIPLLSDNFLYWALLAVETLAVWCVVALIINIIFYRDRVAKLYAIVKSKVKKKS